MKLMLLMSFALLTACKSSEERTTRTQPLLGTFVSITVRGNSQEGAISSGFEEIRRVDGLLSVHKTNSEVARVNKEGGTNWFQVSEELFEFLKQAQEISRKTEGAFDFTIRPLAELYGFIWKEYRLPRKEEIEQALKLVDYKNVEVADGKVRFRKTGVTLDFGAIGKGYAVDRAVMALKENGVKAGMVRAGGDIRVFGPDWWEIQIEDPTKKGNRGSVWLKEGAISTSGNYENFFEVRGKRYSHILNPQTGWPVEGVASCSVIAKSCTESDALATGFFVLGPEKTFERMAGEYEVQFLLVEDSEKLRKVETPGFGTK